MFTTLLFLRLRNRIPWFAVCLVTSFLYLSRNLSSQSLHIDESREILGYNGSLSNIVKMALGQQQPPVHYLIGTAFTKMFGFNVFAARLESIIFATLSVGLFFLLMKNQFNLLVGLGTSLILLTSPEFYQYSRYARPYSIVLFEFLCFIWILQKVKINTKTFVFFTTSLLFIMPLSRSVEGLAFAFFFLLVLLVQAKKSLSSNQIKIQRIVIYIFAFSTGVGLFFKPLFITSQASSQSTHFKAQYLAWWISGFDRLKALYSYNSYPLYFFILCNTSLLYILLRKFKQKYSIFFEIAILILSDFTIFFVSFATNIDGYRRYLFFSSILLPFCLGTFSYLNENNTKLKNVIVMLTVTALCVINISQENKYEFPNFSAAYDMGATDSSLVKTDYIISLNQPNFYEEPTPLEPGSRFATQWLSAYVKNSGKLPSYIIIMPTLNTGYEWNSDSPSCSHYFYKNLKFQKNGLLKVPFDTVVRNVVNGQANMCGAEFWIAAAAIRVAIAKEDPTLKIKAQIAACRFKETNLNYGATFGLWSEGTHTVAEFLKVVGLADCSSV